MGCIRRYISKELSLLMDEMKLEQVKNKRRRLTDKQVSEIIAKKLKGLN